MTKSIASNLEESIYNGATVQEDEGPRFLDRRTHSSAAFAAPHSANRTIQSDFMDANAFLTPFCESDAPIEYGSAQFEWSNVQQPSVRSEFETRPGQMSIYGTSSDYDFAEGYQFRPIPISQIPNAGNPTLGALDAYEMNWEPIQAQDGFSMFNQQPTFDTPGPQDEVDMEMSLGGLDHLPPSIEQDDILSPDSPTTSILSEGVIGDLPSSRATSLTTQDTPQPKRPRASPINPRWNTTRKRRKGMDSNTVTFEAKPSLPSTKISHNAVEKQYRNRLNDKFETLLFALPEQERKDTDGRPVKISKGDVLMLARDYIQHLEKTRERLEDDRKGLQSDVQSLKYTWLERGGVVMP